MKDVTIYGSKTLQSILEDADNLMVSRRTQILEMITVMRSYIRTVDDAVVFAPIIKDYLDVLVKNDDSLMKIATVVQRILALETSNQESLDMLLSDLEKEQLLLTVKSDLDTTSSRVETAMKILPSSNLSA